MKSYKTYELHYIGGSDMAQLVLRSPEGVDFMNFGEDGEYWAYIVDDEAVIGDHYRQVYTCRTWL